MNCQTAHDLLNVYADGELDLINHLEVERHLQGCPSCAQEYKNLQALSSALRDDAMHFRAAPDFRKRLRASVRETNSEAPPAKSRQWRWLLAAAPLAAVIVLSLMFFRGAPDNDDLLAKEIVSSHVRSMMGNHLMDVPSTDQHTVKPWFDGRLDFSPPVIDLASQDFKLVGGRLDYIASRPVAALIYQRRRHFINLFVFPSADDSNSGNKMLVRQGYNLVYWNKAGMTFWAVSDLNLNELQEFAQDLQTGNQ